jgi:hypothetical protein
VALRGRRCSSPGRTALPVYGDGSLAIFVTWRDSRH